LKAWIAGQFPAVKADVEDVVQESYLRIWKVRLHRPIASAKAFLFTIARHLALDQIRRGKISPITSSILPDQALASSTAAASLCLPGR
jgi:RNA polymerase sigma-70 factor (ECF subfamily)